MESEIEEILAVPVVLTDTLRRGADEAESYKQECAELKKQADKLAYLLRAVARISVDGGRLYTRPTGRIMQELEKSLNKALALVTKCKKNGFFKRVITITSANDFKRVNALLDNGIGDITWLLNVSATGDDRSGFVGLPPVASMDPMLAFVWGHIALLQRGNQEEKEDAANALASVAKDNQRNGRIIVEELGVPHLLNLLSHGKLSAAETAARALGYLARDRNNVNQMVADGAVIVFVKVLTDSPMQVQARTAWALAEMLSREPGVQEEFYQHGIIKPLVSLLAFETLDETSKANVTMLSLVASSMAANKAGILTPTRQENEQNVATVEENYFDKPPSSESVLTNKQKSPPNTIKTGSVLGKTSPTGFPYPNAGNKHLIPVRTENGRGLTPWELNRRRRGKEDPQVKAELKAEAARSLWMLAKGNSKTSKSITETKALHCFAKLMETGRGVLQWNSVMAVTDIAVVAEHDADLRRTAFKMSSPAAKAVVEQLLRLIEEGNPDLQVPCIKTIGCLSRTFPARETRVLKPLVRQLEGRDDVVTEAVIALVKFACTENYLHMEHSKAILEASAATQLVQLVYFGEGQAQVSAVILMCYLALHVGESDTLAKAEALPVLESVTKSASLMQDPTVQKLLYQAVGRLEIYQAKGVRHNAGFLHHHHF